MKRTTPFRRTGALAAAAVALSFTFAACSSEDDEGGTATDSTSESSTPSDDMSESMSDDMSESTGGDMAAGDQVFGPACDAVPTSGAGSFDGMVQDPVATAASNNPLLKTLVAAVTQAGLVDTLNSAEGLTVFAPTDDAFAAIPKKTMDSVMGDKKLLTTILTHHVIEGQIAPDAIAGTQKTLAGDTLKITGDADQGVTVANGESDAQVLCGNIPTANATVYVVDQVLMP